MRNCEPGRTLVIGANYYQKTKNFPYLRVPENDKNIILSFHYYRPFLLTHYHTHWTSLKKYKGPVHYPGITITNDELEKISPEIKPDIMWSVCSVDKQTILNDWMPAIKVAKELNLPLYCGEYGVYHIAPKEDALRWYRDMTDLFRQNNIAFAHWEYKGTFPVVTKKLKAIKPLVDILVE